MRTYVYILAGAAAATLAVAVAAAEDARPESERVAQWIARLGSDAFAEREQATKALEEIGPPALAALRAGQNSKDAEVKRRCRELVQKLEKRVEAERVLAPTKVRLSYQDTPANEALADLAKKSGVTLAYRGDRGKLAERRITLATGDMSFWQALDEVCRKAGLKEAKEQAATRQRAVELRRVFRNQAAIGLPVQPAPAVPLPAFQPPNNLRSYMAEPADNRPVELFAASGETNGSATLPVMLEEGESADAPHWYAGAVRVGVADRSLTVAAEPKIPALSVKHLRIDKAVDARQSLTPILDESRWNVPMEDLARVQMKLALTEEAARVGVGVSPALREVIPLRFKPAEKPSKLLKELKGVLTLTVQTPPEPMITVDDVLKAAGKTAKGVKGGSITVREATQYKNGSVTVRAELELPPDVSNADGLALANGRIIVPGNANFQVVQQQIRIRQFGARRIAFNQGIGGGAIMLESPEPVALTLVDAKGERFQQTQARMEMVMNNNAVSSQYVLTFQSRKDQAAPAKLIFSGSRTVTVEVPFELHDIPLP